MFGGHCLASAKTSRFKKQGRHIALQGRIIEEEGSSKDSMAQRLEDCSRSLLFLFFSFIVC